MIAKKMARLLQSGGGIRQASHEAQRQKEIYGEDAVFDLSLGNPSAPCPPEAKRAIREIAASPDTDHRYMCEAGYEGVRKEIADGLNRRRHTAYGADNIVMTCGVAGGLNAALLALLDPGDEVVVFTPYYPAYIGFIENWGGTAVKVPSRETDFQPDLAELSLRITPRTKAVIVNSPHNPSGAIYTPKTARGIAKILSCKAAEYGHGICLLSDEPYRDLVYDGRELTWWPDVYADTIVAYSYSKSLSLAGERIGYLLIPDSFASGGEMIRAVRMAMGRIGYVNAPAFFQRVVGACEGITADISVYDRNRKFLYATLKRCGFSCREPEGAFYIFVKSPLGSEAEFLRLAAERHLIFVPGSAFGMEGYARVSFCGAYDVLVRAVPAFEALARDCGLLAQDGQRGEKDRADAAADRERTATEQIPR